MSTNYSSDIYSIAQYIEQIKSRYIEEPEDTLSMGIFGYLEEIHANIIQNSLVMASEYSNEAIPTKAKFERNVIAHALSLGINKIMATPAHMKVLLYIPEEALLDNMDNNKFILDKNIKIMIGTYEYHLDYDIIINRNQLPNGEYVYTALYDVDGRNVLSDIDNPYLPPIARVYTDNMNVIAVSCQIRQIMYNTVYKKIIVDNPLENKIINFNFDNQLAYFNIEVKEGNNIHYLTPLYDGLKESNPNKEFCNYMYMDSSNIRLVFNRDSYEPRINCEVTINVYTTKGSECNFPYTLTIPMNLESSRFTYDRMSMIVKPISDSINGADKKTIDELKSIIPKEALFRGCLTTSTDLSNFFNSMTASSNSRLYFLEKVHNHMERLFYSYLLLKSSSGNIIPTNSLDVNLIKANFSNVNTFNYTISPGTMIYSDGSSASIIPSNTSSDKLKEMDKKGFLYINPFLCVINKSPFFASYFLNIVKNAKYLNFDYINKNSQLQFIGSDISCERLYFTDRDTYKISIEVLQNINSSFDLVTKDPDGNIIDSKVKAIAIIKDKAGNPYRYATSELIDYDDKEFIYNFQFKFKTNDIIDKNSNIKIESGLYDIRSTNQVYAYLPSNVGVDIYILVKNTKECGRYDLDAYVPNLNGWTVSNKYQVVNGIDLFYNYTNIVTSYIDMDRSKTDGSLKFFMHKMPLLRKTYINSEERMLDFVYELESKRVYIEYCLAFLEDSFGIDFKFFNTYGSSNLYNIDKTTMLNRTNLSLTFEIKLNSISDRYITDYITKDIKTYMENINDITDLHMPNLVTYITTKYRTQLVYFKFLDFNGYGPVRQSIYKIDDGKSVNNIVPEFLNVNTKQDNSPDINYVVII